MRRKSFARLALAVGLTFAAGTSNAQPPPPAVGPTIQPPFSPYLNILRQTNNPGVNYYGIVRPQTQFATQLQTLQNQANLQGPFSAAATGADLPLVTGNAFGFQNYRTYFQNQFSAGGFAPGNFGRGTTTGYGQAANAISPFGQLTPQPGAALNAPRRR